MPEIANPTLVEVTRGALVESRHRGGAAVVDGHGRVRAEWGDIERPVYARSAIKPIQALPLLETGAFDGYQLTDAELALACASHGGEPQHVERIAAWLQRLGLSTADLQCGVHPPLHAASAQALRAAGQPATALHNNCSGKHSGFLTTAMYNGEPLSNYLRPDHPVQQRWRHALAELSESELETAPEGVDGCGIPVLGLGLRATALALARLADPVGLNKARASAARRIVHAMAVNPELVAGSGRFDTLVLRVAGERAVIKTGAEGVYTAILPTLGLGVALKIDDGASRAATVALGALLSGLGVLTEGDRQQLVDVLLPPVRNHAGRVVGAIRPAAGWLP